MLDACRADADFGAAGAPNEMLAFGTGVRVRRNPDTNAIRRATAPNLASALEQDPNYQELLRRKDYAAMASSFLFAYRGELGMREPANEFVHLRTHADEIGFHQVRFGQQFRDLPVLDAQLIVQFNGDDQINLVQGDYLPILSELSLQPRIERAQARLRLTAFLDGDYSLDEGRLLIYPDKFTRARLAYEFHATRSETDRRQLVVDANDGTVLRNVPTVLN